MNKDEALMRFGYVMKLRNLSPHTIKMYTYYISEFLDSTGKSDVTKCDLSDAQSFIIQLTDERGYKPLSANVVISAVRYFFDAVLNRVFSRRQFPNLIYPGFDPFLFDKDQIIQLLSTNDIRMRLVILLGIDCGLRVSEVASLSVSDVDSKRMVIHIRDSKRHKSRNVKLSSACLSALRHYWLLYRPAYYLFPCKYQNTHVSPATVNYWFKKYVKTFDFYSDNIHFHSLRHSFATNMLDNGCDPLVLKKLMGHSSFTSTSRYIHLSSKAVEMSFSLSDIWNIQ